MLLHADRGPKNQNQIVRTEFCPPRYTFAANHQWGGCCAASNYPTKCVFPQSCSDGTLYTTGNDARLTEWTTWYVNRCPRADIESEPMWPSDTQRNKKKSNTTNGSSCNSMTVFPTSPGVATDATTITLCVKNWEAYTIYKTLDGAGGRPTAVSGQSSRAALPCSLSPPTYLLSLFQRGLTVQYTCQPLQPHHSRRPSGQRRQTRVRRLRRHPAKPG